MITLIVLFLSEGRSTERMLLAALALDAIVESILLIFAVTELVNA